MNQLENTLKSETSPYLLQHADNPVHWQPWNAKTLDLARELNKPILLSIGYSACHWCHVMAHESFEDSSTAELMNQFFINIKVDREERPDLDKIYQTSHSLLTGRPGGWPLTVFLTPDDHMPFFAGTYFPKTPQHGMPAFSEILSTVNNIFSTRMDDIKEQNDSLLQMLKETSSSLSQSSSTINSLPIDLARKQIENVFDANKGGFSGAPKFPHPGIIERLLRHHTLIKSQDHDDPEALDMATFTLEQMARGGLFDQLGGGFFRYSTDDKWMIPHFEKMLYDNAQLLYNYSHAFLICQNTFFKDTAVKTAHWAIHEMQSKEGGFYSAMDADTEGEEGKFYAWQADEIKNLLTTNDYEIFANGYGLDQKANFEGNWHLHTCRDSKALAEIHNKSENSINELLENCKTILYKHRCKRTLPGIDHKVLTSWNALMIKGLAYSGRVLSKPEFIAAAKKSADFIKCKLWSNHRLLASYKDGKPHLNAYLDDYAYMLSALIELLQCEWDNNLLEWSQQIADTLLDYFNDSENGGFYFTSHDHEHLIQRIKTFSDDAIPSGNAICAQALNTLGLLTGENRYLIAAENCIKASMDSISQNALMNASMINALENHIHPPVIAIIRGTDSEIEACNQLVATSNINNTLFFSINNNIQLPGQLSNKKPSGDLCIYICKGMTCQQPLLSKQQFRNFLENKNETN